MPKTFPRMYSYKTNHRIHINDADLQIQIVETELTQLHHPEKLSYNMEQADKKLMNMQRIMEKLTKN